MTLTAGVYHVDQAFIDDCDDGYFLGGTSTFEVRGTASGELLYELGLRNGDVVRTFNGTHINRIADAMEVFTRDYLTRGGTEYELKVNRSGTSVTLSYEIDP